MTDAHALARRGRIERLLQELQYEITRGMMEREIEEEMGFRFLVPVSRHFPNGVVECEFRTRPSISIPWGQKPGLQVVSRDQAESGNND